MARCNIPRNLHGNLAEQRFSSNSWHLSFVTLRIPLLLERFSRNKNHSYVRGILLIAQYVRRHEIKIRDTWQIGRQDFCSMRHKDKGDAKVNPCASRKCRTKTTVLTDCIYSIPHRNKFATGRRISFRLQNFRLVGHLCSSIIGKL